MATKTITKADLKNAQSVITAYNKENPSKKVTLNSKSEVAKSIVNKAVKVEKPKLIITSRGMPWTGGKYGSLIWEIKHFQQGSQFGIKNGKISKLFISDKSINKTLVEYDRGWSTKPTRKAAKELFELLLKKYN